MSNAAYKDNTIFGIAKSRKIVSLSPITFPIVRNEIHRKRLPRRGRAHSEHPRRGVRYEQNGSCGRILPGNPQTPGAASASDASEAEGTGRKEVQAPAAPADTAPGCTAKSLRTSLRDGIEQRRRALARRIEYNRLRRIRRHSVPAYVHCKNCGETLRGMYCHRCGQYALDPEQPFWKYFKQYFENVYQFDSKVWQTLWLLSAARAC